jgi:HSP20 family protein
MLEATIQNRGAGADTSSRPSVNFTPRFDLWENDSEFVLVGDLPGVEPHDLEIQFENQELRIHGKVTPRREDAPFLLEEYGVGDYYRSFTTGDDIDGTGVAAKLELGVLTVHLPKRPEVRPRRIEVTAG